jgi:hypothetical protein
VGLPSPLSGAGHEQSGRQGERVQHGPRPRDHHRPGQRPELAGPAEDQVVDPGQVGEQATAVTLGAGRWVAVGDEAVISPASAPSTVMVSVSPIVAVVSAGVVSTGTGTVDAGEDAELVAALDATAPMPDVVVVPQAVRPAMAARATTAMMVARKRIDPPGWSWMRCQPVGMY